MPNTPARLARAALTTVSGTLYTVPAATKTLVTAIAISNTTTGDILATLNLGGVAYLSGAIILGRGITTIENPQVLTTGETITGLASIAGLNIFISGVEVT